MIGQVIGGKYEIVKLLGEGGMGAVYEARVTEGAEAFENGRCAVKLINDEAVARDEVLITRFKREAQAAQKVHSPHIVEIHDAGHDDATGHPFMVMEMLQGENALQVLDRIGPMPPQLAVRVGIQTCRGLAEAHEAGVVHRDIKPANLFLCQDGPDIVTVKLLDFGVAKFKMDQASESDNESLTRTGSMLGSPMYMSPEQARGLKTIDHRADIWSMGIVMHQLLSGRVPHQDIDGLGELIITICSETPPLVSEQAPWVSTKLAEVIGSALQLSSDDRFQTAREMAEALEACLDDSTDDGWKIGASLVAPLSDADKQPYKADEPEQAAPAAAPAQDTFAATVALDAIPDLSNLDLDSPKPAPAAPAQGLSGTLALSAEELEELDAKEQQKKAAKADAGDESPSAVVRRDERALAKHRSAQRAAIEAARLGPEEDEPRSASRWFLYAVIGGVILGVVALFAYRQYASAPAPSPQPSGSATAVP